MLPHQSWVVFNNTRQMVTSGTIQQGRWGKLECLWSYLSKLKPYCWHWHLWIVRYVCSYIPYPFPLAQMATAFVIIMTFIIPTLMLSKTEVWYGFVLNFLTVLLFAGLNEIARELEYPFKCMPNDIPVRSRGTIHKWHAYIVYVVYTHFISIPI